MITLTENAAREIGALQKEQDVTVKPLRVYVEAGGCSGMEYGMAFDDKKADDEVVRQDGVEVVIDSMSANFLKGSVIDYVDSLQGSDSRSIIRTSTPVVVAVSRSIDRLGVLR